MGKRRKIVIAPDNAAVVYARYSSKNQNEATIDAQKRICEEYAKAEGLEIIKYYCDIAKTGTNDQREELQQMIDDSSKGLFSKVLIHKLDRFFRNLTGFKSYSEKLEKNGVILISVAERFGEGPAGEVMKNVMASIGQFFSDNLSTEVKKGQREGALKSKHLGGIPPLGYAVDPATQKYIIAEEEAKIVRIIFNKYAAGDSYNEILKYLNSMGFYTKRGNEFGKNSLNSILNNEKYTGKYIFGKTFKKSYCGEKITLDKPEKDWIVDENGIPAIIDTELFDKVQEKLKQNKQNAGRNKAKVNYLLSGLLYCGECGSVMQGNTRCDSRHGSQYSSYDCSKKSGHASCNNRGIRKGHIEDYVIDSLFENLFPLASIKSLADMLKEYVKEVSTEASEEMDFVIKESKEVEKQKQRILDAIAKGIIDMDDAKKMLESQKEKSNFLSAQMEDMKQKNLLPSISEDLVFGLICQSRDFLKEQNMTECRNFIEHYVEEVRVYQEDIEVKLKNINAPETDE